MRTAYRALTIFLFVVFAPIHTIAWQEDEHRTVAAVAAKRLNFAAEMGIAQLLGTDSMESVANWADIARRTTHPHSGRWHFVAIPFTSEGYEETLDCTLKEAGDCTILAIPRAEKILLNLKASQNERKEALMFLIHLVADLHNPIHAIQNNDSFNNTGPGGIDSQIELSGQTGITLHNAWDGEIARSMLGDKGDISVAVENWLSQNEHGLVVVIDPSVWAAESFQIGKKIVYPQAEDGVIDGEEAQVALTVIEERLALASIRLAAILNNIFSQLRNYN